MGMSHLRQPAASLLRVCLPEVEESRNAQLLPALSSGSCLFRKQILRCNFQRAFETELVLVCAFELQIVLMFFVVFAQSPEPRSSVYIHVHTHASCLRLLSNNFHILLILKGQKLLGSRQWVDGGWLNMHLIPFGLVSVSKPPTFLSQNHSYRSSNQFRPQPCLS